VATIVPPDTSDKIAGQGTNTRTDSGAGPHFPIGIASIIENGKSDVESRSKSCRSADAGPNRR
jgi:hypothetical protein